MRSRRFTFIKVFAIVSMVAASSFALDAFQVGIKAGLNMSSLWGQGVEDFADQIEAQSLDGRVLWSFAGGVYTTFVFAEDFFAIQPEVLYRRVGRGWDAGFTGIGTREFDVYTDYLSIPILAKFSLPLDFFLTPFAYAGPELNIAFRSRATDVSALPETANLGFVNAFRGDEDIFDDVNNPDFGLVLGLGANMAMGPGAAELDLRYSFGFLDVYDVPGGEDIRNNAFTILLGYALQF